jgi:pimeloyl-ACP methyl ester carboxylesterase
MAGWYFNMRRFISLALLALSASTQALTIEKGFVELRDGQSWYVEHIPAADGKPTLFLANGLTWSTKHWDAFVNALQDIDRDIGIVRFDMSGMGETLLNDSPPLVAWPITIMESYNLPKTIELKRQAQDVNLLRGKLKIKGKVSIAGLSYGGAVSIYGADLNPDLFDKIITFAPLLRPVAEVDAVVKYYVKSHRALYPFDPRSDDELYNRYLWYIIYTTFPHEEPALLDNPYILGGVYQNSAGARYWESTDHLKNLKKRQLYVIGAMNDEYVKDADVADFWQTVPERARASYIRVKDSKHRLPLLEPELMAKVVYQILMNNPYLSKGLTFETDSQSKKLRSGETVVPLNAKKVGSCESLLRNAPKPH